MFPCTGTAVPAYWLGQPASQSSVLTSLAKGEGQEGRTNWNTMVASKSIAFCPACFSRGCSAANYCTVNASLPVHSICTQIAHGWQCHYSGVPMPYLWLSTKSRRSHRSIIPVRSVAPLLKLSWARHRPGQFIQSLRSVSHFHLSFYIFKKMGGREWWDRGEQGGDGRGGSEGDINEGAVHWVITYLGQL